jgi:hypothetical protein
MSPATYAIARRQLVERLSAIRIDRNDHLTPAAEQLGCEFVSAFFESPEATVRTPAYSDARKSIAFLVKDSFDGSDGDKLLRDLLRIVARAAQGENVRAAAMHWIAGQATEFAEFNAADLAREMEEDAHAL